MSRLGWWQTLMRVSSLAALILASAWSTAWAQNENETVGFRPGHAFESGTFGENIDVLNGGLNLSIPVGQRFQVNSKLGYALVLAYNSKVWDTSDYNNSLVAVNHQVVPTNMSPFGIGFSLQLGRITKDIQFIGDPDKDTDQNPGYIESWRWISPDGTQHEFFNGSAYTDEHPPLGVSFPGPVFARTPTSDLSYALISGPSASHCQAGLNLPQGSKCFKVEEQGGIVFTLVERVQCANPPDPTPGGGAYGAQRAENQSFCGWYTALVEDRTVGTADATTGYYPHHVKITYDSRIRFEHAISRIEDSVGRVIEFHSCEWSAGNNPSGPPPADIAGDMCLTGSRDTDQPGYAATMRAAVATTSIEVPVFGNAVTLTSAVKKSYSFTYEYVALNRPSPGNTGAMADPSLKLVRVSYPEYRRPGQSADDVYSLYFGYAGTAEPHCGISIEGNFGELSCRTLPLGRVSGGATSIVGNPCQTGENVARINYTHNAYQYTSAYLSGGHSSAKHCAVASGTCSGGGGVFYPTGMTRQVATKTTTVPDGAAVLNGTYKYCRSVSSATNPSKVVVNDPYGNETVYLYHASVTGSGSGTDPEDGLAPEWSDGLNYRVSQYEGTEAAGRLVRTTMMDHDADPVDPALNTHRGKSNVRVRHETVRFDDDGGRVRETWRNGWNGWGEWTLESTVGFDVTQTRQTRREFAPGPDLSSELYLPNLVLVEEVSDGSHVLTRSDLTHDTASGRLISRVDRASPPPFGSPWSPTQFPGDVKTTFAYSAASGNVLEKEMTGGPSDGGYRVKYTYAPAIGSCAAHAADLGEPADVCGGYLRTKTFLDNGVAGWKAIDRDRDANTGLVFVARDTAGIGTTYTYDPLGRVGSITPQGEETTTIDYVSLLQTKVSQGSGTDMVATTYSYDGLGRLVATAKRPADPDTHGVACQTSKYDKNGRTTFKSEWWYTTGACAPGAPGEIGTSFEFTENEAATAVEPFGRVRRIIPPDGSRSTGYKVTRTEYFGTSSRVTVSDVAGLPASGSLAAIGFPIVTTYYRDALERLLYVDSPSGGRCSHAATTCSSDNQCPAGETCVATDGGTDAIYTYDALDRLMQVDLTNGPVVAQSRRFEYDGLGRLRLADNPESGITTNTLFDALGNVLESRDASGALRRAVYDFAGRLVEVRVTAPGGTEMLVARNTYDEDGGNGHGQGKLTTIESFDPDSNLIATEHRTYDALGARLSRSSLTFADWSGTPAITTDFTYGTRGELTTLAYPIEAGATRTRLTVNYTYKNGYLTSAKQAGAAGNLADVTYNPAGGIAVLATHGGGRSSLAFDAQNRPKNITMGQWNGSAWDRIDLETGDYSYDGAGNISQIGPTTFDPAKPWIHTNRYYYDAANRLVRARTEIDDAGSLKTYLEDFGYDVFGNMTTHRLETLGTPGLVEVDNFTPTAANDNRIQSRRTTFSSSPGADPASVPFSYDLTGNLVEGGRLWWPSDSSSLSKVQRYEYDSLNRLMRVHSVGDQAAGTGLTEMGRYGYDASGNRVWKLDTQNGIRTYFVRDAGGQVLSEFRIVPPTVGDIAWPGSQEWAKDHVYFVGRLLSLRENLRPEAPAGLATSTVAAPSGYAKFKITWNESTEPDKADYVVYRYREDIDSGYSAIATVTAGAGATINYTDPDLHAHGTSVHYQVSCRDTAAYESAASAPVQVLAGDVTKPTRPTLTATAGDRRITLYFSSSDGSGLRGYRVYRGTTSSNLILLTATLVTETTYVDTNLTNGTTYWYQVDALDALGRASDKSCQGGTCPLSAMPKDYAPPSPPQGLSVACGAAGVAGVIDLSWSANPSTDNVARYYLYRNTTPDFSSVTTPIATLTPPTSSYPDSGLTAGIYYYALRAEDNATPANLSQWSSILSATAKGTGSVPTERIWTEAGDGVVNLTWSGSASPPDRYRVYRKVNALDTCYTLLGEVDPEQVTGLPSFLDVGMQNDTAYDYALTTVTGGVESAYSMPTLGIPVDSVGGYSQCFGPVPNPTIVFWQPPINARPYQPLFSTNTDGSLGFLQGYRLYHHAVGAKNWDPTNCAGQLNLPGAGYYCADDSLIRTIIHDASDPRDPYRLSTTDESLSVAQPPFSWNDLSYQLTTETPVDPPFGGIQEMFRDDSGNKNNCVIPRGIYSIYAEGTWLSVESGWPDQFDPLALHPRDRCAPATYLLPFTTGSATCDQTGNPHNVPAPTNLTAIADGPGAIKLTWSAPTLQPGAPPIVGYYVYGLAFAPLSPIIPKETEFRRPLAFATVAAGTTTLRVTGLAESPAWLIVLKGSYRFRVVSVDAAGHMSSGTALTSGVRPSLEVTQPGVPRSLKTVLWTLNDAEPTRPRSREGIKVAWSRAAEVTGWGGIQGFRIYRSDHPDGPYCALLQSGYTPEPALPAGVTVCPESGAPEGNYTAGASAAFYWDRSVEPGTIYYYRVTQLETDAGAVVRETPFESAEQTAGRELLYRGEVLPPPQGLRAYAPLSGPDMPYVHLAWCPIPTPDASETLPAVSEYRVHKRAGTSKAFRLFARISPTCLETDASGQFTNRCVVTDANACLTSTGSFNPNCPIVTPSGSCTGSECAVVDQTFTCWPEESASISIQNQFRHTYMVTAQGETAESESVFSEPDEAWLNYCGVTVYHTCGPTPCRPRRDPDGSATRLLCGDEQVRLEEDSGWPLLQPMPPAIGLLAAEDRDPGYQVTGQGTDIPHRFVFYHLDHLGSPRVVLDTFGARVALHHYLPFGEERPASTDPTLGTKAFTGHERDAETGIDYMLARYYSSSLGRFMSVDPVETGVPDIPQSWNKYVYGLNNPLSFTDPRGTDPRNVYCMAGLCDGRLGTGGGSSSRSGSDVKTAGGATTTDFGSQSGVASGGAEDYAPPGSYIERIRVRGAEPSLEEDTWWIEMAAGWGPGGAQAGGRGLFAFLRSLLGRSTALHLGEQAGKAGAEAAAAEAAKVTFGHGVRHLVGRGLNPAEVEAAIAEAIQAGANTASGTGSFWGRITVQGQVIEYRAFTLSEGIINVGTYYPVK